MPATEGASKKPDLRKRVYKTVSVIEAEDGFGIALDERPLNTPSRTPLRTSSKNLADAVAEEWDAQKETIDPASMPLSKLLNTALDRVAPNRDQIIRELVAYVDTDMLCYRAETPQTLIERQQSIWQPVLDWMAATYGVELNTGSGLMPLTHPNNAQENMEKALSSRSNLSLTAAQAAASLTGSLSLGLALADQHLSGEEVFAASQLDETWQLEQWGEDADATTRRAGLESDLLAVARFVALAD